VFVSVGTQNGGAETTALTFVTQLAHHGMVFVPCGYSFGEPPTCPPAVPACLPVSLDEITGWLHTQLAACLARQCCPVAPAASTTFPAAQLPQAPSCSVWTRCAAAPPTAPPQLRVPTALASPPSWSSTMLSTRWTSLLLFLALDFLLLRFLALAVLLWLLLRGMGMSPESVCQACTHTRLSCAPAVGPASHSTPLCNQPCCPAFCTAPAGQVLCGRGQEAGCLSCWVRQPARRPQLAGHSDSSLGSVCYSG